MIYTKHCSFRNQSMLRLIAFSLLLLWCAAAQAHHWVIDIYNENERFVAEVEVKKFSLINPHPVMFVEIVGIPSEKEVDGIEVGQTWSIELDNRRELVELGFNRETFIPGDKILVAVDPSYNTAYRKNTLYLRAVEHQRESFVYVHNVRQLYPADPDGGSLAKHLDEVQ